MKSLAAQTSSQVIQTLGAISNGKMTPIDHRLSVESAVTELQTQQLALSVLVISTNTTQDLAI